MDMKPDRNPMQEVIRYGGEAADALAEGMPVVALESTIITHGMPYPENIESARRCEAIIREEGCVPATIAIIRGKICVGLEQEELSDLGMAGDVRKASRRDLPMILAKGLNGAATVAATMVAAHLAGIRFFATGGIGGVHRGGSDSFDVSADLLELARTPVAVVCAGAKSILDIGLTLEVLETQGVPVVGYRTDRFPAFYLRDSGYAVDDRVEDVLEIARALRIKWGLGMEGGMVVANPIPIEAELEREKINASIDEALQEANARGIRGKDVTPFLLARLNQVTCGESLAANKALVYHNARVAAQLAAAYQTLA